MSSTIASEMREMSHLLNVSLCYLERRFKSVPASKQNIILFVQNITQKDHAIQETILLTEKESLHGGSYDLLIFFLREVKKYLEVDSSDEDSPRLKDHLNFWVELHA